MVSATKQHVLMVLIFIGLNPYYAGRWFLLTIILNHLVLEPSVLILIMLEGGFCFILIKHLCENDTECLNPYYAGRWFLLDTISTNCIAILRLNPYYAGRWFLLIILIRFINKF